MFFCFIYLLIKKTFYSRVLFILLVNTKCGNWIFAEGKHDNLKNCQMKKLNSSRVGGYLCIGKRLQHKQQPKLKCKLKLSKKQLISMLQRQFHYSRNQACCKDKRLLKLKHVVKTKQLLLKLKHVKDKATAEKKLNVKISCSYNLRKSIAKGACN